MLTSAKRGETLTLTLTSAILIIYNNIYNIFLKWEMRKRAHPRGHYSLGWNVRPQK